MPPGPDDAGAYPSDLDEQNREAQQYRSFIESAPGICNVM